MSNGNGNGNGNATRDEIEELVTRVVDEGITPAGRNGYANIGLALVPFTPVPFTGSGALHAWGRLAFYGTLSFATYSKYKKASAVFGAAAGISLLTSLAAKSWEQNQI